MTTNASLPSLSTGSTLLGVSLVIFLISATLAGFVWFKNRGATTPAPEPTPTAATLGATDVLNPEITIDESLTDQSTTIQTNLITPVRQHYATREERLSALTIIPADDDKYPTQVSLTLVKPGGSPYTISFRYDLSRWTPSHLNND